MIWRLFVLHKSDVDTKQYEFVLKTKYFALNCYRKYIVSYKRLGNSIQKTEIAELSPFVF